MPDKSKSTEKPKGDWQEKPVRFVLPRGISAEAANEAIQKLLEKHGHKPDEPKESRKE